MCVRGCVGAVQGGQEIRGNGVRRERGEGERYNVSCITQGGDLSDKVHLIPTTLHGWLNLGATEIAELQTVKLILESHKTPLR